jgi:hypothetical protein
MESFGCTRQNNYIFYSLWCLSRQILPKRSLLLLTSKYCYRSDRMARPHTSQTMESRRKNTAFWNVMSCDLALNLQRFKTAYCDNLRGIRTSRAGNNKTGFDYSPTSRKTEMCSSKKSVNFCQINRSHIPENFTSHGLRGEDLRSKMNGGFQFGAKYWYTSSAHFALFCRLSSDLQFSSQFLNVTEQKV